MGRERHLRLDRCKETREQRGGPVLRMGLKDVELQVVLQLQGTPKEDTKSSLGVEKGGDKTASQMEKKKKAGGKGHLMQPQKSIKDARGTAFKIQNLSPISVGLNCKCGLCQKQ